MNSKLKKRLDGTNVEYQILYMHKKGIKPHNMISVLKKKLPKNRIPKVKVMVT